MDSFNDQLRSNSLLFLQLPHCPVKSLNLDGNNNNNLDHVAEYLSDLQNQSQDPLYLQSSCNGLLLLESNNFLVRDQPRRCRFYVCNPSTRNHSELMVPDYIVSARGLFFLHLAFDPSKSPYYKVIIFWNDYTLSRNYNISIYSSETETCRRLDYTFEANSRFLGSGEYCNGAIFWSDHLLKTSSYFDINEESIHNVLPNPPYSGAPSKQILYFGGDGAGRLHLILRYPTDALVDVYELKDDYSSWVAKYKVDLDAIAVAFPEIIYGRNEDSEKIYMFKFLCVLEKEEDRQEEASVVIAVGTTLLAYNFKDKTTKKLCNISSNDNTIAVHLCKAFRYTETLFDV